MGRFITVTVQCDWDGCDVQAVESDDRVIEKTLSIDGKQAKAFLLCKLHLDLFEEMVLPLMAAGIKVEQPSKKTAKTSSASVPDAVVETDKPKFTCRVPDCGRPMKNRAGMAQHVIRAHGFADLADYEATYPDSTID